MKNKLNKFIATILIINILLTPFNLILCNISFGYGDTIRNEIGPKPSTHHVDDDEVEDIPGGSSETTTEISSNYIYYTNIEGNAYEQIHEEKGAIIDYNNNPGIPYIKVKAKNETDGTKYEVYTDSQGDYSFRKKNLTPGTYTLTFYVGGDKKENIEISNQNIIKSNLKYNGIDYIATAAGKTKDTLTIMEKTITQTSTGATEIMLAIDCSSSAWNTKLADGRTRLEIQKEAAKKLIESLLNEKNVFIGIICFSGDKDAWRAVHATNNKEILINTLDELKVGGKCYYRGRSGGTNIIAALDKADKSFVSDESNKWIVLLSDGAPTTDGNEQVYSDDTDEDFIRKLEQIAQNTKKKIKKIVKKGINMCSFIVDSEDNFETQFVNAIFKGIDGNKYLHSSDEEATKTIKEDILKHIIEETTVKENVTSSVNTKNFNGIEDEARRKKVNELNSTYDYEKSNMIQNLINNYNDTYTEREQAKEFLNNSYITVTMKQKYNIDKLEDQDDDYWYFKIAGMISKSRYTSIDNKTYTKQNLELTKRLTLDMEVEIKVTGYRLTLSNGQIYNQKATNGVVDKDLDKNAILKDEIAEIGNAMFLQSIEEKLMYGARVDIEYTIILKNIGSIPASNVTLINYLTDFTTGNDLQILEYDENRTMISNDYTNADYGWNNKVDKKDLIGKVSDETYNNLNNYYYVTLSTKNSPLLRQGQQLGANGERYIKIVLSKHLSTDSKNDNTDFSTTTEILNYSNDVGIRMQKKYTIAKNKIDKVSVIPGNSITGLNKVTDFYGNNISETDYAKSMRVVIIPPTGGTADPIIAVIIFVEVLLIVFIRKLRIISRR